VYKVVDASETELTAGNYKNVGSYKLVLTGLSDANYELDGDYSLPYEIIKADLNPSLKPTQVTYGEKVKLELLGNYENAAYTLEVVKGESVGLGTLELVDGAYEFTATRTGKVVIRVQIAASDNCNAYDGKVEIEVIKAKREVAFAEDEVVYGSTLDLELTGDVDEITKVTYIVVMDYSKMATVEGNVFSSITPNKESAVGEVRIQVTVDATENYEAMQCILPVTVLPRPIKVKWLDTEKIYNGKEQFADCEIENILPGDECGMTIGGGHVDAATYVDARVVSVDNPNYTVVGGQNTSGIFTIGKQQINVKLKTTRVDIGVPTQLEIEGNVGNGSVTYSIEQGSDKATLVGDEFTGTSIGTVVVKVRVAETTNYLGQEITDHVVIGKKTLDIKLKNSSVQYSGELKLELEGNTTSYVPKYSVTNDTGSAEIIGGDVLKATRAGQVIVKVFIPGDNDYDPTTKEFTVNITPILVTVRWNGINEFVYTGKDTFVPGYTLLGLLPQDEGNVNLIIEGGQIEAGTWNTAYATGIDSPNYTLGEDRVKAVEFTIKKAPPTIEFETKAITINVETPIKLKGNLGNARVQYMLQDITDPAYDGIKGAATIDEEKITGTQLGWVYVCATVAPSANFDGTTIYGYILVEKPEAPVDFTDKEVVYGDTLNLNVINTDEEPGATYTFKLGDSSKYDGSATLSGNVLTATGAGKVIVIIEVPETETYKKTAKEITITVKPIVVEVSWTEGTFTYNGTEQKPTAQVTNTINGDTCELEISGQTHAGNGLTAEITGVKNANYTIEGATNLTTTFDIAPLVVTLGWTYPELTFNGEEQTPEATVTNKIGDDVVKVIVSGVADAGTANVATATMLGNSDYTLEGCTNVTTTYEIKPFKVELEVVETEIPYCGKAVPPEVVAKNTFNGDVVHATCTNIGINVGEYTAYVNGLDNSNYTCDKGAEVKYKIVKAKIEFDTLDLEKEYNGSSQDPTVTAKLFGKDTLNFNFTFTSVDHKDVGEYPFTLSFAAGGARDNYYIADEDKNQTLVIKPKAITILVTTKTLSAEYTGSKIELSNWYDLSTDGFVGTDVGKKVEDVFDLSTLALIPEFRLGSVTSDEVGARGTYDVLLKDNDYGELKSANYVATFAFNEDSIGELTISGEAALKVASTSKYEFIFEEVVGNYYYRRTYTEKGWVHGKDDTDFERVVLGNIAAYTTVGDFLENFAADQLDSIRVYNGEGDLIFDCGKPADGVTNADLYDENKYLVGTGWRITFGKDEDIADVVYVSVLGDLNGDGKVNALDVVPIGDHIKETKVLEDAEKKLAAILRNSGTITASDISALGAVIRGAKDNTSFF